MGNKLDRYRLVKDDLPSRQWTWPLYGAGLQHLGRAGAMIQAAVPLPGPDELLTRVDAVGLCFSDVKIVQMGSDHPRLTGRDLAAHPVVPGHEVAVTVAAVGADLAQTYAVGQRFSVQPAIWYRGRSMPFGYTLDGGFQQYCLIGKEILQGDAGCYLLPVPVDMTYVGAALTEPWACVEASYRNTYRESFSTGGRAWFVGRTGSRAGYQLDKVWRRGQGPTEVVASQAPADLVEKLEAHCRQEGATFVLMAPADVLALKWRFDDILTLDCGPRLIDQASSLLADGGVLAIACETRMAESIHLDMGRVHYDHTLYVGTTGLDLDAAYQGTPPRTTTCGGGTLWVLGAGGPMGRMHVQRALESADPPRRVLATNVTAERTHQLLADFAAPAAQRGVELHVSNPVSEPHRYAAMLADADACGGVDDVEIMASDPETVAEASRHLATGGVVNLFAGLKRGTLAPIDPWEIYGPHQARFLGHSGSGLDDQLAIMRRAAAGELAPERSLVAVGGLQQVVDALRALEEARYPGKIVIFPQITEFPLTALRELGGCLTEVFAKLDQGRFWTGAAEDAFLDRLLP